MSFWTQIIISSSSGTITLLAPSSGAIDAVNKDFGFSSKPSSIVVNGAAYRESHGWSWTSGTLTATLDFAPDIGGDVYAIK